MLHSLAHWWQSLTISQASLVVMALFVLYCIAMLVIAQMFGFNDRPVPPRRKRPMATPVETPWPITDYSDRYDEKAEWLGDRHLMANPVNRATRPRIEPVPTPKVVELMRRGQ